MKSLRKKTGKKREERDEFLGFTDRVKFYLIENSTKAYAALAVVAGVIIITVVVSLLMRQSFENQVALQAEALAYYDLEAPVPGDKPLQAADRMAKARELFDKITKEHSGGPIADMAAYYKANADVELGELESAIAGYRALFGASGTDPLLRSLAGYRLGSALRAKGDVQGAADVYSKLAGEGLMKDDAHYMLGLIYEEAGQADKALMEYAVIGKDFPNSPWAPEAKSRADKLSPPAAAAAPVKK